MTTNYTFKTIADVKRANKAEGYHWFDKATIGFFGTRFEGELVGGRYFITSEDNFDLTGRVYHVRDVSPNATICTAGEFGGYDTLAEARAALDEIVAAKL